MVTVSLFKYKSTYMQCTLMISSDFLLSLHLTIPLTTSRGQCDARPSHSVLALDWVPESTEVSAQFILGVEKRNFRTIFLSLFWKNLKFICNYFFGTLFYNWLVYYTALYWQLWSSPIGESYEDQVSLRDSWYFILALWMLHYPCRPLQPALHTFAHSMFTYQNHKINTALASL